MAIKQKVDITGYSTLRSDLLHLADEENKTRLALIELQKQKTETVGRLLAAADKLFARSLEERTADGELRAEFKPETDVESAAEFSGVRRRNCGTCGEPGHRSTTCPKADVKLKEKKAASAKRDEKLDRERALKPGQRACSICRRPGHRAKNCPEASE